MPERLQQFPAGKLNNSIEAIRYLIHATGKPRMESLQLAFILEVAKAGKAGINMQTAAHSLEVDPSFISRNTKAFGPQGMDTPVIEQRIDHMNPKFRILTLTPYGVDVLLTASGIAAGELKFNAKTGRVTPAKK